MTARRRAKTSEIVKTDQGCPALPHIAAGQPHQIELGQASDRWNRSSEPMQCIGKTPVHNHGKANQQDTGAPAGEHEAFRGGVCPLGCCGAAMGDDAASLGQDRPWSLSGFDGRFDRRRSTGTGAEVQGGSGVKDGRREGIRNCLPPTEAEHCQNLPVPRL